MNIWEDPKHEEWADLARRTEPFVDKLTGRNDIYVTVRPDMRPLKEQEEMPRPAGVLTHDIARIALNPNKIFDMKKTFSVADVDPMAPRSQRQYPEYTGVTVHEASHGKHTSYRLPRDLEGKVAHWVALIEEPRCERWMIEEFPQYAVFIKAMVTNVLNADKFFGGEMFKDIDDDLMRRYQAGQLCLLIMARAEYGVYEWADLSKSEKTLQDVLGKADYAAMKDIWTEALELEDHQMDEIIELAKRIQAIIDPEQQVEDQEQEEETQAPCGAFMPAGGGSGSGAGGDSDDDSEDSDEDSEDGDDEGNADGAGASGGSGSSKGKSKGGVKGPANGNADKRGGQGNDSDDDDISNADGSGGFPMDKKDDMLGSVLDDILGKALKEEVEKAAEEAKQEIAQQGNNGGLEFARNQLEIDAQHRTGAKKAEDKVLSSPAPVSAGFNNYRNYNLTLNVTAPGAVDTARARAMEVAIRQAQYREVIKTSTASLTPPGRMSMRAMVAREGQVAARQQITAKPWAQTHRRVVENPPITLAIATDISGSMDAYQREVGSFSWAFAQAIRRNQGKVGALAWDSCSHHYIKPGTLLDTIPYYSNGGSSEGLPSAISALDSMMNLSFGEGVRMLAIITDGALPNNADIQNKINILHGYGVHVLWILTRTHGFRPQNTTVAVLNNTAEFGKIVGPKVIELLAKA